MSSVTILSPAEAGHTPQKNLFNAILMVAVAVPLVYTYFLFVQHCDPSLVRLAPFDDDAEFEENYDDIHRSIKANVITPLREMSNLTTADQICRFGLKYPAYFVNILFFFGICVVFWLMNLVQSSTWLIDPYWTIIPVMINYYFRYHPLASFNPVRADIVMGLIWLWSLRLTHSYFRREEWNFGLREDWRFADYRLRHPTTWWWMSFFVAYLAQQVMLFGLTLPMYSVHFGSEEISSMDYIATFACLAGMAIAFVADTQLREFMIDKEIKKAQGKRVSPVLNSGLWYYSRHPNYFGEQLFWWGLFLFAAGQGNWWMVWGTAFNTVILLIVTAMTEERMLRDKSRAHLYKIYQESTSAQIPWFTGSKESLVMDVESEILQKEQAAKKQSEAVQEEEERSTEEEDKSSNSEEEEDKSSNSEEEDAAEAELSKATRGRRKRAANHYSLVTPRRPRVVHVTEQVTPMKRVAQTPKRDYPKLPAKTPEAMKVVELKQALSARGVKTYNMRKAALIDTLNTVLESEIEVGVSDAFNNDDI